MVDHICSFNCFKFSLLIFSHLFLNLSHCHSLVNDISPLLQLYQGFFRTHQFFIETQPETCSNCPHASASACLSFAHCEIRICSSETTLVYRFCHTHKLMISLINNLLFLMELNQISNVINRTLAWNDFSEITSEMIEALAFGRSRAVLAKHFNAFAFGWTRWLCIWLCYRL